MFLRADSAAAFAPSLNARAPYLSAPTALIVTPERLRPALREKFRIGSWVLPNPFKPFIPPPFFRRSRFPCFPHAQIRTPR
jgi:hypothetical protein